MYDNNENQNFNNNQYNNMNGVAQQPNNMQPQYNNYGPAPSMPQNNGYYNQTVPTPPQTNTFFGGNTQNNAYENQMYNNMNNGQEEPPELSPIKPLSSVQAVDVPNMDVLNPMNIMPETLPTPGSTNPIDKVVEQPISNEPNYNVQQDLNVPYPDNVTQSTSMAGFNNAMQPSSMSYSNNMSQPTSMAYSNEINQVNNAQYNTNIEQSVNMPYPGNISQQPDSYESNQMNNMDTINPNSMSSQMNMGINNLYNSSSELMSNVEQNKSQGPTMPQPVYPDINMDIINEPSPQATIEPVSQELEQVNNIPSEPQVESESSTYNNDINNLLDDINNSYGLGQQENNVEISDISLSENTMDDTYEIQDDILDNNMDSSSIDSVETMDLDTNDDTDSDSGEAKLLSVNVEKIKELIEEIKSTGVNISLEEFDFEEMYQLIIKINK